MRGDHPVIEWEAAKGSIKAVVVWLNMSLHQKPLVAVIQNGLSDPIKDEMVSRGAERDFNAILYLSIWLLTVDSMRDKGNVVLQLLL